MAEQLQITMVSDEDAEGLNKTGLCGLLTFCGGSGAWSGAGTGFIRKQTTLYTVHQNSTKTAGCHLTKSEGFLKNACKTQKESDGG